LSVAAIAAIGIIIRFVFFSSHTPAAPAVADSNFAPRKAQSLNTLLAMPADQLADMDIAEMNLLCATGMPGAEELDVDHCLATLDRWARHVKAETQRHLYRAHDPRWADHYRHSETCLRAEFLLQVLQEDLGVKYDMRAVGSFSYRDSRVAFLHGMIPPAGKTTADTPGGTCASMPVMYVAMGRRLGYPLKLVTTDGHVFVRWDGKDHPNPAWRDRFNIEGTGGGFSSYDDKHYMTWPKKLTAHEVRANGYLVSLTPREELAMFLAARGHCGFDNGRTAFAARCYENAYRCDTTRPCYRAWFLDAAGRCGYRPGTPELVRLLANRRRRLAVRRPAIDTDFPLPSTMGMPGVPGRPHIPHTGPRHPQPVTSGMVRPPMPATPQVTHPQPYQPPISGRPRR